MGRGLGGRALVPGPGAGGAQIVGDARPAGQVDLSTGTDVAGLVGGAWPRGQMVRAAEARRFGRRCARRAATPGSGSADAQGGAPSLVE
eukprot:9244709-Alexandrium_andersonii.AAC.1